jgi:acyl-CoA hydrolase
MPASGWQERLGAKTVSADEAVASVGSGMRVYIHSAAATPHLLVEALTRRAADVRGVRITHIHSEGAAPYLAPELSESFRHEALFVGPNAREAVNIGRADYIPVFLSEIPALFRTGGLPVDVAFLNISLPDEHGYCSLGVSVDCSHAAAMSAGSIVAQLNASMPRTLGQGFIHVDQLRAAVYVDEPPAAFAARRFTTARTPSPLQSRHATRKPRAASSCAVR